VTQSTSESFINTNRLEDEIARLRLIVGSLREELWQQVWSGLYMDEARYNDESHRLIYGEYNE
jgi:hypothetical protein